MMDNVSQNISGRISVEVHGEFACFSRPEFKVERVSYPVITPSAARGILEAIFWKPEIRYEIRRIGIVRQGTQISIMRNEIDRRQADYPISIEKCRQQRTSLLLKEVDYIIVADMIPKPYLEEPIAKYSEQFKRRVERGQYHHMPYLGTREFPALFFKPNNEPSSINMDIGLILFDIAFIEDNSRNELEFIRHTKEGAYRAQGYAKALYFNAYIKNGWLDVPEEMYKELYRIEGGWDNARCS